MAESEFGKGLLPTPPDLKATVPFVLPKFRAKGTLPQEIDLSDKFPSPRSQGKQGSCTSWAMAYYKTYLEGYRRSENRDGEDRIVSPAFIFNQIGNQKTCAGSSFYNAFKLLQTTGVVSMRDFPYDPSDCRRQPNDQLKQIASSWKLRNWRQVDFKNQEALRTFLASGQPMVISVKADKYFDEHRNTDSVIDTLTDVNVGNHAIVLVGYSESRQAFRILNSWGTDWGDKGYGWISYRLFPVTVNEAWIATEDDGEAPVTLAGINDDSAVVRRGQANDIRVLDNDKPERLANPKLSILVAAKHGPAVADGAVVRYVPAQDYTGDDEFYYAVRDDKGGYGVARVSLTVLASVEEENEAESWTQAQKTRTREALANYVRQYPSGKHADEAKRALVSMKVQGFLKKSQSKE